MALCGVALAVVWGLPGSAAAETVLAAEAGYGGYIEAGRPFPLLIEVSSDSLFVGELLISSRDTDLAVVKPVEVPGGTARRIAVLWESSPWGVGGATVRLVAADRVVAAATVTTTEKPDVDLVGVFPALAGRALPGRAPLLVDAGEAMLFPVDPAALSAGWAALEPLDIIVVTAADLRALDDSGLDALLAWVNQGGRLMVDEPPGVELPGVPAPWQPPDSGLHTAGIGEIVATGGAAASGDWDALFEPAPTRSRQQEGHLAQIDLFWRFGSLSSELARDAGISFPGTGWIMVVVGAYVAVAGPAVWLLARGLRRPGLAWVLIPVAAVGFAAGIWVFGSNLRNNARTAHATVVEVAPRGTVATTYSLLHSSGGGRDSVSLPPGWSPVAMNSAANSSPLVELVDGPAGSTASIRIDAGGFSVLGAGGTLPEFDGALEVTARSASDGRIAGTVANNLAVDLHQVAILADADAVNIGTVPAGATVEFDHEGRVNNQPDGELYVSRLWPAPYDRTFGPDVPRRLTAAPGAGGGPGPALGHEHAAAVNLGLWSELSFRQSLNSRPVGQVVVAGWTDELASPLDPGVAAGRTLLLARAPIEPDGGGLSNLDVPRAIVRGPNALGAGFGAFDGEAADAFMLRFVLPEEAAPADLVLAVPPGLRRLDLWSGAEWRTVDPARLDEASAAVFALSEESAGGGRVYLRVQLDLGLRFPALRALAVRSLRADDRPSPLSYVPYDAAAEDGSIE